MAGVGLPGFSILAWVDDDSPLLTEITHPNQQHTLERRTQVKQDLLHDFAALIGVRWSFDITLHVEAGEVYAFGVQPRFTVGTQTINNALGALGEHVKFIRSSPGTNLNDLIRYQQCKKKWGVPESVTESFSGWDQNPREETSTGTKRKRS
ncbi:nonstructural protein 3 [Galliform chaphamaparvovirus 10]|nr:nonstructural protein 3 [Galliform chaphamaparvovirus 10]